MGMIDDMGNIVEDEIDKMRKKQELKSQLEKAKNEGRAEKEQELKSM